MRKIVGVTLAAVTALGLTACTDRPGVDFWGNPIESESPSGAECAVDSNVPPPGNVTDVGCDDGADGYQSRPDDIVPGNNWIKIGVNIKAQAPDTNLMTYAVPIQVTIEIETEPGTMLEGRQGPYRTYQFDDVMTPWLNHYVPFQYDPGAEQFRGNPPRYNVRVSAKYVGNAAAPGAVPPPRLLACEITIWSGVVASGTQLPGNESVRCALGSNQYDRYDQYKK